MSLFIPVILLIGSYVTASSILLILSQLAIFVGNNLVIFSLTLAIFTVSLAYGLQGFIRINYRLKTLLFIASLFLGIGISSPFVALFFSSIHSLTHYFFIPFLFYSLVIIVPLACILGCCINQLLKQGEITSGTVLHSVVLGSMLGLILTPLFFLNFFGIAWTLLINFLLLQLLILMLSKDFLQEIISISMVFGLCLMMYSLIIIGGEKSKVPNSFESMQFASANTIPESDKKADNTHITLINNILAKELKVHHKNILVLGNADDILISKNILNNHFSYLGLDAKTKPALCEYIEVMPQGDFITGEVRNYVRTTSKRYDLVILDPYSGKNSLPNSLLTYNHFLDIHRLLTPAGIAIITVNARPTLADNYSKRLDNTIRAVFANCMSIPLKYSAKPTRIIYLCSKTNEEVDRLVYADNLNASALDYLAHYK